MRKLYALFVKNRISYDISDDIRKYAQFLKDTQQIELAYDVRETDLNLTIKDFGVKIQGGDFGPAGENSWGLANGKDLLRPLVPSGRYHMVFLLYDDRSIVGGPSIVGKPLLAWTYFNPLNGAAFSEMPASLWREQEDVLFRMLTHEGLHCEHRLAWWKGYPTPDTLDQYDKEFDIFAPDGNRARNIKALAPFLDIICQKPKVGLILDAISAILARISALLPRKPAPTPIPPPQPKPPVLEPNKGKIEAWALAGQQYEGFYKPGQHPKYPLGTLSYRNNNPGNLKYSPYTASLGAYAKDAKGFAIFRKYEDGFEALLQLFRDAANLQLRSYRAYAEDRAKSDPARLGQKYLTLLDFYEVYAPRADSNEPNAYSLFVSNRIGVTPTTRIRELLPAG